MIQAIIDYKKNIASRYIPFEGGKLKESIPEFDNYYFSEKLDGHLFFAHCSAEGVKYYNRSGTEFSIPALEAAFPKKSLGTWAGELYVEGERSRAFNVRTHLTSKSDKLRFGVFDSVEHLELPRMERLDLVKKNIPASGIVHHVEYKTATSRKEIFAEYEKVMEKGGEGLVITTPINTTYKVKPQLTIDLAVIGYSLRETGEEMHDLLLAVAKGDQWIILGKVGGGFSEQEKKDWFTKLQPLTCESSLLEVASNGLIYQWVKPQIVIEVKCLDLIIEDSSGPIRKQALTYDEKTGYAKDGKIAAVSIVSPVFVKERDDKKAIEEDCGFNQVSDRIEVSDSSEESVELKPSQIVLREVYVKEGKGGKAIRKFVGWKTNKEDAGPYPKYVLYFTDFSAGRKEPLQSEIYIAPSEDELRAKLVVLIEENVKKGWNKV